MYDRNTFPTSPSKYNLKTWTLYIKTNIRRLKGGEKKTNQLRKLGTMKDTIVFLAFLFASYGPDLKLNKSATPKCHKVQRKKKHSKSPGLFIQRTEKGQSTKTKTKQNKKNPL